MLEVILWTNLVPQSGLSQTYFSSLWYTRGWNIFWKCYIHSCSVLRIVLLIRSANVCHSREHSRDQLTNILFLIITLSHADSVKYRPLSWTHPLSYYFLARTKCDPLNVCCCNGCSCCWLNVNKTKTVSLIAKIECIIINSNWLQEVMAGWKKKLAYLEETPWFPKYYIGRIGIGNCDQETSNIGNVRNKFWSQFRLNQKKANWIGWIHKDIHRCQQNRKTLFNMVLFGLFSSSWWWP